MNKKTKKVICKLLFALLIGIIFLFIMYLVLKDLGLTNISEEKIKEIVSSYGALAPIVFTFLTFMQVTFIPIPSTITVVVGNYLFGFWASFFYSYLGMILGSMVAFFLGRLFCKKLIYWIAGKEEVDKYLLKLNGRENILLFFMFLFPFFPDDLLCMIAGILPISWVAFLLIQLVTRATSIITTLLVLSGDIIPFNQIGIPIIAFICIILTLAFYICYKNSDNINNWLVSFINKFFKKNKK